MFNMKIRKLSGVLALAMVLTAVPISANATEVAAPAQGNEYAPGTEEAENNLTNRKGLDPSNVSATGAALSVTGAAIDGSSIETDIAVWGFTEDATVYSVDVEWGAMTFQWENSSWDPETHMKKDGAGWKVYDSVKEKALDAKEDAINEIKVTNHSNASVWATLAYASEAAYDPDTTGDFSFISGTEATDTNVLTAAAGDVPAYLTLDTADNATVDGGAGTPTVGKAYFMPVGLAASLQTDDGIAKWTKIGTITVGIEMEEPTAVAGP